MTVGDQAGPLLIVHGGAGHRHTPLDGAAEQAAHAGLQAALSAGLAVLRAGGTATDAVVAAVRELEDCPSFNSGHGAALTSAGTVELDAALMDGTGAAGAVTSVKTVRNPITAARRVMETSPHVLFANPDGDLIAGWGVETVPPEYFVTAARVAELDMFRNQPDPALQHGTVGAVARDVHGAVAAGTSTGGIVDQTPGRVGDTPIIGAGTYANNDTVAVSCTGTGETFMQEVCAYQIHSRIAFGGEDTETAVSRSLAGVAGRGGMGGIIALGPAGPGTVQYNSGDMFYGAATLEEEETHV